MVKVMQLVDLKILQQMSIPSNAVHRTIATLDQDMQAVLDRQDISDEDKVRHYNQILQRYLEYHDRLKSTAAPSPPPSPPPPPCCYFVAGGGGGGRKRLPL